jgi:hypothetical protein
MGIKRLISHNATPTMINATTRFTKGIFCFLARSKEQAAARWSDQEVGARRHGAAHEVRMWQQPKED